MNSFYMPRLVCPWIATQKARLFGLGDEAVQCTLELDNWILQRKNELSEEFCVTDSAIQRGADTSSLWTADGKYQGFFYIQYTQRPDGSLDYGCNWSPLWMSIGETYQRNAYIVEYWWDGRIKAQYPASTALRFVEFHAQYTFPKSGITVANVAELSWGGEEDYFYADSYGLVGWLNTRTGAGSFIGSLTDVRIQQPVLHPHPRPLVSAPPKEYPTVTQPTYPPPTTGGVLASLTTLPGKFINVRAQPNLASATSNPSADVGDLALNDVVKWFPDAKQGEWVYTVPVNAPKAAAGWVSLQYGAVAFTPVTPQPSTDVVYSAAEHAKLIAAIDAVETELNGLRKQLKGAPTSSGGGF